MSFKVIKMEGLYKIFILTLLCLPIVFSRKNVLFLIADDMRPEIYAYKNQDKSFYSNMETPNLDVLAGKSLVMKNAYVQQAVCAPSRASFMTSRRPDTTHTYDLNVYWREVGGNFTTLPQYFKENGYETIGIGKIYHPGQSSGNNDPISWTLPSPNLKKNFESSARSWEAIDDTLLVETPLIDEQVATSAIETLRDLADDALTGDKPFFLAAGFYKPHLPFVFPMSMLDFYPESDISIPTNRYVTENLPARAWNKYGELRAFDDMSNYTGDYNETFTDEDTKALRRAYFASVTWIDSQIGRILQELELLGLAENTIVSFIGDHGFHLGEHAQWCKWSNFELSVRAPMMVHIPELTECGIETDTLTEFVDLFPTIVDAAGLQSVEQCNENSSDTLLCTEGTSLLPLIAVPCSPIKTAAFSQITRRYHKLMGYSMRTERYRYTEWVEFDFDTNIANWDTADMQREMYDHTTDTGEDFNIVDDEPTIAAELSVKLRNGWRNSLV